MMTDNYKIYWRNPYLLLLILGCAGAVGAYLSWDWLRSAYRLRLFFDPDDLNVYFQSSRWVVGQGILYKEVFSEYPLFANLIFGFFRYFAATLHPLSSSFESFSWLWLSTAWLLYIWIVYLVATKVSQRALWMWLAPAALYFSVLRFDIYPALMTFLALLAIRNEKYVQGAFWLGLAIALKGYALFLVPAYLVYLYYKKGFWAALKIISICLAPFILSQALVFAYAGLDGLTQPYSFHFKRTINRESTYAALTYLLPFSSLQALSHLDKWLQIAMSLLAAALKPKKFEDLVHAFLIAVLGFISFSVFHSPQFLLWTIAIACFSSSFSIVFLASILSWITYIYFPLSYGLANPNFEAHFHFKLLVILMAIVRLTMLCVSFVKLKAKTSLRW